MQTYWGKALPLESATHGHHPLLWHMLDVAATAEALLARHAGFAHAVAVRGGASAGTWIPFLAAIHDLGKVSAAFQAKQSDLHRRLQPEAAAKWRDQTGGASRKNRHDWLGPALWTVCVEPGLGLGRKKLRRLRPLVAAICGHHGAPPRLDGGGEKMAVKRETVETDRAVAPAFVETLLDLLAPASLDDAPFADMTEEDLGALSFLVAALVNVADWLGSNQTLFPYRAPTEDPGTYWRECARPRAARAADGSGLAPHGGPTPFSFASLFPEMGEPRPLQRQVETMPLPAGPILILVEDSTGSGKTEAADILAARLMAAGRAHGVYFALPTMTTADAIADRHASMYRRLFGEASSPPDMSLVHGGVDEAARERLDAGGAECRAFIAGDRRLQLSADLAVGTLDQALLAVLPVRFMTVRLYGLVGKVLVVDEAHAYDAYTGTLLAGLLRMHAAYGGSAIVMSATLPTHRKVELATAFAKGMGGRPVWGQDNAAFAAPHYPSLTTVAADGITTVAVEAAGHTRRTLQVRYTDDQAEIEAALLETARAGGCAVWMRNSVDDAIEGYERLRACHDDVTLLHARFARSDRRRLESRLLKRFGKNGPAAGRRGGIVVSTQVLEQSLDLDFDGMAVDLKPLDAVLQSAGRLRRHSRAANGSLLPETADDARPRTPLLVFGPDPNGTVDADWYRRLLPRAAPVYEQVDRLWRTAAVLARTPEIAVPDDLRKVMAAVYDDALAALPLPDALETQTIRAEGNASGDRSFAEIVLLRAETGYRDLGRQWSDDVTVPTRLGDALELCLVRRLSDGAIGPWDTDATGETAWLAGALRVSAGRFRVLRDIPERAATLARKHPALKRRIPIILESNGDDVFGARLSLETKSVTLRYDRSRGLEMTTDDETSYRRQG